MLSQYDTCALNTEAARMIGTYDYTDSTCAARPSMLIAHENGYAPPRRQVKGGTLSNNHIVVQVCQSSTPGQGVCWLF